MPSPLTSSKMSNSFSEGFDHRAVVPIANWSHPIPDVGSLGACSVGYDCTPAARSPADPSSAVVSPLALDSTFLSALLASPQANQSTRPVAAPRLLETVAVAVPLPANWPASSLTLAWETAFGTRL